MSTYKMSPDENRAATFLREKEAATIDKAERLLAEAVASPLMTGERVTELFQRDDILRAGYEARVAGEMAAAFESGWGKRCVVEMLFGGRSSQSTSVLENAADTFRRAAVVKMANTTAVRIAAGLN